MNKKICVSIIIALIMIVTLATSVLAANEDVTLVKVKDNVCTIKLGEDGEVIKQLISVDNEKKEVTLQIDVKNLKSKEEETKPTEMFLVVDDSKDNTLTSNFGEYYYLGKCIERKSLKLLPKLGSYLDWIICGYGERPFFCIFSALGIIIIFSFLYLITGIDTDGRTILYTFSNMYTWNISKFIKDFNEALNLSVGMFAGVGIDNGKPTEIGYLVANLEMLIGIVLMGVGVGTLVRKVIR